MMLKFSDDSGKGNLGTIIWLLVAVACIYFALKFVPVKIDAYAFKDAMAEEASFASQRSDKVIQANLLRLARQKNLPIDEKILKITREHSQITVEVDYTVNVETIFFTHPWHFQEKVIRDIY